MKRSLALAIAVVVLLVSAGVAWWARLYANSEVLKQEDLAAELDAATVRQETADRTHARIEKLDAALSRVEKRVVWESDPTNILRWFADTADATGTRLLNSQVMTLKKGEDLVGDKRLRRTQYTVRVRGDYSGLVRYLDRVERSPYVMIVEDFSLAARRKGGDEGELELTASSLCRIGLGDESPGEDETALAGESDE